MKGLTNEGNTCYFNSSLQCLLQVPALSNKLLLKPYSGDCEFTKEYSKLTTNFWLEKKTPVVDSKNILNIFRQKYKHFNNSNEHDAQEALLCIIDCMEKSMPSIKNIFYGEITKNIIYSGGKTSATEKFSHLFLTPSKNCTLEELFEQYFKDEVLEGYEDDTGKKHHVAVLKQGMTKPPTVLIFALNMFSRKYDIKIPEKFMDYALCSMCVHMGNMNGGHYVSFTKHKGQWYFKDDNIVRKVDGIPSNVPVYFCLFKRVNS